MTVNLEVKEGQKIDPKQLLEEGWRDAGKTRRKRTIFEKECEGRRVGLLLSSNNTIFLITKT